MANEIFLKERPGRLHHSYIKMQGAIVKINERLLDSKKEPNRNVFQLQNFMAEADVSLHVWKRSGGVAEITFGSPSAEDRIILSNNEQGFSLKMNVWNQDSPLVTREITKVRWNPSVHALGNFIVHITGKSQAKI